MVPITFWNDEKHVELSSLYSKRSNDHDLKNMAALIGGMDKYISRG